MNGNKISLTSIAQQFEDRNSHRSFGYACEDNASTENVFTGRFLKSDGNPLTDQPVKLFLNDTQVTTLTTVNGYVEFRRHFDPGNESDSYNVQATYDGSGGNQQWQA